MKINLFSISKRLFCKKRMVLNHLDLRKALKIAETVNQIEEVDDKSFEMGLIQSEIYKFGKM